jgi:hypothetical protein
MVESLPTSATIIQIVEKKLSTEVTVYGPV